MRWNFYGTATAMELIIISAILVSMSSQVMLSHVWSNEVRLGQMKSGEVKLGDFR